MAHLIISFTIVTIISGLAGFVAARAWDFLPARLFLVTAGSLLFMRLLNELTAILPDAATAYWTVMLTTLMLALLSPILLLLFSSLFMPEWFAGRRPIVWILLPYVLVIGSLLADMLLRTGIFVAGLRPDPDGYIMQRSAVAGLPLIILFAASWMVHVSLLIVAFIRRPDTRVSIGILIIAVVVSSISGTFGILQETQSLPITIALTYIILRGRLLTPTRAGMEHAVRTMDNPLIVFDTTGTVTFANPAAERLDLHAHTAVTEELNRHTHAAVTEEQRARTVQVDGRQIALTTTALVDQHHTRIGTLVFGRDLTDVERQAQELADERARLAETVAQLRAEQAERVQLADTVRSLEFPVIPALPGVIILPLVGTLDQARANEFLDILLQSIEQQRARLVLLDITGVPLLDAGGAAILLNSVRSARLLGARCVLVGMSPEIAQALVSLGVSLSEIDIAATLQQALQREVAAAYGQRSQ